MRFRTQVPKQIAILLDLVPKPVLIKEGKEGKKEGKKTEQRNKYLPNDFPDREHYNYTSYFLGVKRQIDPMFVAVFYGLFTSNELPPMIDRYTISGDHESHDFGGGIDEPLSHYRSILYHSILGLWIQKNGYPQEVQNLFKYRQDLYTFLAKVITDDYFMEVLVPFYLDMAVKHEDDFIDRFCGSNFIPFEPTRYSPEWLSLAFQKKQEQFYNEISSSLNRVKSKDQLEFESILKENENGNAEFKSSSLWSRDLSDAEINERLKQQDSKALKKYGKLASKFNISRAIASFLNSNGGNLIIGVKEDKEKKTNDIIGIDSELPKLNSSDQSFDGYRRMIIHDIIEKFLPDFANVMNDYIVIKPLKIDEKTLCWITIKKTSKPVFLKIKTKDGKNESILPVRRDAETKELIDGKEITDYIGLHF
jgi:hypothetical protein